MDWLYGLLPAQDPEIEVARRRAQVCCRWSTADMDALLRAFHAKAQTMLAPNAQVVRTLLHDFYADCARGHAEDWRVWLQEQR